MTGERYFWHDVRCFILIVKKDLAAARDVMRALDAMPGAPR